MFFISSCRNREGDKISNMLTEWIGREIIYPNNMVFTLWGSDTVDYIKPVSSYTIVSYVDSIGCVSCKLQLAEWKVLIAGMDSTFKDKVSVLLFFCPKRNEAMSYILKRDGFGYPVCIDQSDTFNKLNHFLDEMAFQTFLLDRNNRIIALGNPVLNPNIKKLYWNIIQGKDIHCSNKRKKSKINIENNIIENNEGLIILANETYYKTQYMNFTKNQIKDFTGDIMDYSYFYNSKNFDGSANEEYTGDSTSFLDKIFDFVKNLWDEYVKGKNSVKDPNNVDTNKNTTSSGSDVADNTDDSRDDIKSNSTDSSGDSDVGDSLDKSHYSAKNSLSESESNVGDSSSGLSSDSSSPEVHELEKSNVSKDIADDNYLIWIVLVIVVIFALLAIGYNKR